MRTSRWAAIVIVSYAFVVSPGCGDDADETDAQCNAPQPVRVAALAPGIGGYMSVTPAGDRAYINIYRHENAQYDEPARVGFPDLSLGVSYEGGQTWVTGLCGQSPVQMPKGAIDTLYPLFRGADGDPTFACDSMSNIYRVDVTGASAPELLLDDWSCYFDRARSVAFRDDGDSFELWHVPGFPDLDGAVRLAAGIERTVARDGVRDYYLDKQQALHAVAVSGPEKLLQADIGRILGGPTDGVGAQPGKGPVRLLWATGGAGQAGKVQLFRGDTDEILDLADVRPTDESTEDTYAWAWALNSLRTHILYQPLTGDERTVTVYDRDGAPVDFPPGVHASPLSSGLQGVLGDVDGPQGRRWVYAPFGTSGSTPLDMPWEPDELLTFVIRTTDFYYYDYSVDRIYSVPLDGSPASVVPDTLYDYGEADTLSLHNEQLFHVDPRTGETTLLHDNVGAFDFIANMQEEILAPNGLFYTDVSSRDRPTLWYMPTALLPGEAW